MKDYTNLFERAFAKNDMVKQNVYQQNMGGMPIYNVQKAVDAQYVPPQVPQKKLTPEQRGALKRKQRLEEQKAFVDFVKSITQDEYDSLLELRHRGHIIIDGDTLEQMGEEGESLGIERLEKAGAIKREKIPEDNLYQFRLAKFGLEILKALE